MKTPSTDTLRIALLQGRGEPTREAALQATVRGIRAAAAKGARVICTQELFLTS